MGRKEKDQFSDNFNLEKISEEVGHEFDDYVLLKPIKFTNPPQYEDGSFRMWNLDPEEGGKTRNYEFRVKDKAGDVRTMKGKPKNVQ